MHPKCSTNYTKVFEPEIKKTRQQSREEVLNKMHKVACEFYDVQFIHKLEELIKKQQKESE